MIREGQVKNESELAELGHVTHARTTKILNPHSLTPDIQENLGSRQVYIAGLTASPNSAWMAQQVRILSMHVGDLPTKPRMLIRDDDTEFTAKFDGILESEGIEIKKVSPQAPNMNAIAESWVQDTKQKCLDPSLLFGEKHLRHILRVKTST